MMGSDIKILRHKGGIMLISIKDRLVIYMTKEGKNKLLKIESFFMTNRGLELKVSNHEFMQWKSKSFSMLIKTENFINKVLIKTTNRYTHQGNFIIFGSHKNLRMNNKVIVFGLDIKYHNKSNKCIALCHTKKCSWMFVSDDYFNLHKVKRFNISKKVIGEREITLKNKSTMMATEYEKNIKLILNKVE